MYWSIKVANLQIWWEEPHQGKYVLGGQSISSFWNNVLHEILEVEPVNVFDQCMMLSEKQ